jgi:predicted dehydrogenase
VRWVRADVEQGTHPRAATEREQLMMKEPARPGTQLLVSARFVTALERGDAISPSLDDGLKAQAIAEAATRSLATGKSEIIT